MQFVRCFIDIFGFKNMSFPRLLVVTYGTKDCNIINKRYPNKQKMIFGLINYYYILADTINKYLTRYFGRWLRVFTLFKWQDFNSHSMRRVGTKSTITYNYRLNLQQIIILLYTILSSLMRVLEGNSVYKSSCLVIFYVCTVYSKQL